jgi:hypothetical protein
MSIISHHEDASVYGSGVVLHPLGGRPEFKGVVDAPQGPFARIEDGDLVLRIDDVATLERWSQQMSVAAQQLAAHQARIARSQELREVRS